MITRRLPLHIIVVACRQDAARHSSHQDVEASHRVCSAKMLRELVAKPTIKPGITMP
jgi:hypothetical protein